MNRLRFSAIVLVAIIAFVYWLSYATNFLGPYGTPNDGLHLLILIAVLFFTFLIFQFTVLRRRGRR